MKNLHFLPKCVPIYISHHSVSAFSSKTLQVAQVALLELFSLQNHTSRTLTYVSDVFWCSEGSESQSCVLSTLERPGAPESPKPNFFIRVRRFCVFREPQKHFWRSWAVPSCPDRHWGEISWRTEGRNSTTRDGLAQRGGPSDFISRVRVC